MMAWFLADVLFLFCLGIMTAAMGLGPAVGFVLGGSCLDTYVDFNVLDADK